LGTLQEAAQQKKPAGKRAPASTGPSCWDGLGKALEDKTHSSRAAETRQGPQEKSGDAAEPCGDNIVDLTQVSGDRSGDAAEQYGDGVGDAAEHSRDGAGVVRGHVSQESAAHKHGLLPSGGFCFAGNTVLAACMMLFIHAFRVSLNPKYIVIHSFIHYTCAHPLGSGTYSPNLGLLSASLQEFLSWQQAYQLYRILMVLLHLLNVMRGIRSCRTSLAALVMHTCTGHNQTSYACKQSSCQMCLIRY